MNTKSIRILSIIILLISFTLWGTIIIPSMLNAKKQTTTSAEQQAIWQESPRTLTDTEEATMSADFAVDFEKNLTLMNATPTPTPFFAIDVPASMAGDLTPPTVTIQDSVAEGTTINQTSLCFPLWLSDNMTPWQQLTTHAKMDTNQWSIWMPLTQYCYQHLTIGKHVFTVQIRDLAGNVSSEVTRTFTVSQ